MPIPIDQAIEVFVRGFCFTKSFAHPYVAERIGSLWLLRDAPGQREPRKIEWVAHGIDPGEAVSTIRDANLGWHFICALAGPEESAEALKIDYKARGYRLLGTEGFFSHPLFELPSGAPSIEIERVLTPELAETLRAAAGRQLLAEHLDESAPLRQYVALDGHEPVGWVRSITVGGATWCSNLYVVESHRRKGIASALMARMLGDDQAHGAEASVLTASRAGAQLYPRLGYEKIGDMLIFSPKR